MAEETKKAIEELAKACDGNEKVQAFLEGLKYGLQAGKAEAMKGGE